MKSVRLIKFGLDEAGGGSSVVNGDHTVISGGQFGGEQGVVFLAAVVGNPITFNVTIQPGTASFVTVINTECSVIELTSGAGLERGSDVAPRWGVRTRTVGVELEQDTTSRLITQAPGTPAL